MAFVHVNFYSDTLKINTDISLIIPTPGPDDGEKADRRGRKLFRTLTMLHGTFGDHTDWARLTGIERLAQEYGIMVIMPSGANGFYRDMKRGKRYFTYITEELPSFVENIFPVLKGRENHYIGGLSMGGYGAVMAALKRPDIYGGALSFSGTLDLAAFRELCNQGIFPDPYFWDLIFDKNSDEADPAEVLTAARQLMGKGGMAPELYFTVGRQDPLYKSGLEVVREMKDMGFQVSFEEDDGAHEWDFWDRSLKGAFKWLDRVMKS
ncbi:MAG: esterase family protein [Lachnospiraceae bacterium]|nr:esterase family protein [Lachnospiraceae bacterium]